jgi:tryptophan synthase beta chain
MVRDFQSVIGVEARKQILESSGRLPYEVVACVGGGSNAIGIFSGFMKDRRVRLTGVEAGGRGIKSGLHAARFAGGRPGVLHGTYTYLLQDKNGQVTNTHSVSAGLDYPAIGPEHAALRAQGRACYAYATDIEAVAALKMLCRSEGILPALESAHALAYVLREKRRFPKNCVVLVNLSGRGDKDMPVLAEYL